jgi:F-type H+-transporting ATPase subunit b
VDALIKGNLKQMRLLTTILIILSTYTDALSAEEQSGAGGQTIFNGSFADAVWTVLAFVLLLIVLSKYAWKPMLKGLKTREEHIRQQINAAEKSHKLAEQTLEDYKQQGLLLIKEATDRAIQHEQELTEKARQEVLAIRQQAREDIEHARNAAEQRLWDQAGEIVLSLGTEVFGRVINDKDNQQLVRDAVGKLRQ